MSALQHTSETMRLLGDPTRIRLLALLAEEELTVAELTQVTQLSQSRVSTHLGKLREAALVRDRRAGSSAFYALNQGGMPAEAEQLWAVIRRHAQDDVLEQDLRRARELVRARTRELSWADTVAGQMERHYSPGRTWEASARGLLGLCQLGDVLDVASGDGALAELLAPRARSITCLDTSERVIAAAEKRLRHLGHVRFEHGDMHQLPFAADSFDAVLLMNCLTYAERPQQVIAETVRVLRPGGLVTGVTLKRHKHERHVASYNHVNCGFTARKLRSLLSSAGLTVTSCEVTSREKRPPHFEVMTFHAHA